MKTTHPQYDKLTWALLDIHNETILGLLSALKNKTVYDEDFEIKVFGKLLKNFNHRETLDIIPKLSVCTEPYYGILK